MPRQKFSVIKGKEARIDRMILARKSISETAKAFGVSYHLIKEYIESSPILFEYWIKESVYNYKPVVYSKIDKMALEKNPPTLEAMARLVEGITTREGVSRYLKRRGEYEAWKKNAKKKWNRHINK